MWGPPPRLLAAADCHPPRQPNCCLDCGRAAVVRWRSRALRNQNRRGTFNTTATAVGRSMLCIRIMYDTSYFEPGLPSLCSLSVRWGKRLECTAMRAVRNRRVSSPNMNQHGARSIAPWAAPTAQWTATQLGKMIFSILSTGIRDSCPCDDTWHDTHMTLLHHNIN